MQIKNMPDKLCLLVPLIFFFLFMFPSNSPNHRHIFVNYISIKMTLRYRYNNTLFIILFQQQETYFLLTATHSTWRVRKRERGKKSLPLRISQKMKKDIFSSAAGKKKLSCLTRQSLGGSDQNLDIVFLLILCSHKV